MWRCRDVDSLRCTSINQRSKMNRSRPHHLLQSRQSHCLATMLLIFVLHIINAHGSNVSVVPSELRYYHGSRYSINELLNTRFRFKVSDDIDMDPCKASMWSNFILLLKYCWFRSLTHLKLWMHFWWEGLAIFVPYYNSRCFRVICF